MTRVILVDGQDEELGVLDKLRAHELGLLHRAFSTFIFDSEGRLLLQRRAREKYHSGGLWSNSCCGHPQPGELLLDSARRRLREEMAIDCGLTDVFCFQYRTELPNGLIEHEFDHVLTGVSDAIPRPDPREVEAWRRRRLDAVQRDLANDPTAYTAWFAPAFHGLIERMAIPSAAG